ncbi:hypothetical protein BACI349Y_230024 [Bacillus sp. 349Y]|nr:hypothetical protein BACI349Y_230024 [Bacillus sp. 349Y]
MSGLAIGFFGADDSTGFCVWQEYEKTLFCLADPVGFVHRQSVKFWRFLEIKKRYFHCEFENMIESSLVYRAIRK